MNYLAGGSAANPTERGLNIPVDMAFAFHSDAGTTLNDSIIGTLGIYQTDSYKGVFANGASRYLSHDLTDLIQSNIVRDIRTLYEPQWTRRGNGINRITKRVYPKCRLCCLSYFPTRISQICDTGLIRVFALR